MRLIFFCTALAITIWANATQLDVYPGLPDNYLKSEKYVVKVKLTGQENFQQSYVYVYKNNGVHPNDGNCIDNDPCNILNSGKRSALADASHFTTFSFDGSVELEITKLSGNITWCDIRPYRYNLQAEIMDGKAYFTLNSPMKKMLLTIDNDEEHPLFIFADELEKDVPGASDAGVLYFGPGIHTLEKNHPTYAAYYQLPANIHTVYIAGGAYVKGAIYTKNRSDVTVRGRGILSGEGISFNPHNRPDAHVYYEGSGNNQVIEGITIIKPLHYHVMSRGTVDVDNIKCFSYNNTTDGWGGGTESTCTRSFFKVNDDVIKLYANEMYIADLVVYHQTNSPIFEFGWSGQEAKDCTVERIDIVWDNSTHPDYPSNDGSGILGWANVNSDNKVHAGHVFTDIRSDGPYKRLIHLNMTNANSPELGIELNNFALHSLLAKSDLDVVASGSVSIECNQVTIAGNCISQNEFILGGAGDYDIDVSTCNPLFTTQQIGLNGLQLYPIPFKDHIIVNGIPLNATQLCVYNVSGKEVYRSNLHIKDKLIIDMQHLTKGIYILSIESNYIIQTRKIVKIE